MGRIIKAAMLASALFFPQAASANPPSGILTGTVMISTSFSVTCNITFNISGSSATITFTPGNSRCGGVVTVISGPTSMSVSGSTVTFHNVMLRNQNFGLCYGDLVTNWNGTTLSIGMQILPSTSPTTPPCGVSLVAS